MKILILGAKGNLGQQLIKVFATGNEVIGWDKGEIDITDRTLVFKKIKDIKPNAIINAAAYNAVDKCEASEDASATLGTGEFELAKRINGEAPAILAQAAIDSGAVLVHYSSDYVFGGHAHHHNKTVKEIKQQGGFMEDDEPRPVNKYGQTKLIGELQIIKLSGKGLKWYLIRTSKLFGPKGESELAKPSFFEIMLKLAKEKNEIDVINDETSCFTYTPDLAKATKELIDNNAGYGIYHITNSEPCTWYRAAKELFKIAGVSIKVNPVPADKFPRPAKRPKYSVLLNTKLEPMRDFREALREYLNSCHPERSEGSRDSSVADAPSE
ncbi:dTDP-4-dehydrorhamnose reductase [Candidatus Falkowbacteria bacterium]|nr:dTDP-4-dehydrorhamnose reductase [Candidatus Falkowbacteria bacterium]